MSPHWSCCIVGVTIYSRRNGPHLVVEFGMRGAKDIVQHHIFNRTDNTRGNINMRSRLDAYMIAGDIGTFNKSFY